MTTSFPNKRFNYLRFSGFSELWFTLSVVPRFYFAYTVCGLLAFGPLYFEGVVLSFLVNHFALHHRRVGLVRLWFRVSVLRLV